MNKDNNDHIDHILNDSKFLKTLGMIAEDTGEDYESLYEEARSYIEELHSVHNPYVDTIANELSQYILSRGYEKTIDISDNASGIYFLTVKDDQNHYFDKLIIQ